MPLKLIPPRKGKSPYWSVRGTHLGIHLDRSTKSRNGGQAAALLRKWRADIERGALTRPGEPTFFDAAVNYMAQTGNDRFVKPVLEYIGKRPLVQVTQQLIDEAAVALYPTGTPATRNRQAHTVVSAVLKHAGIDGKLKRPKGWRGSKRVNWLTDTQAFRVFASASKTEPEFALFLRFLCYTGMRLGEALALTTDRVMLEEGTAYLVTTKNDDPRTVYLPTHLVHALQSHPRGMIRGHERVFKFVKCGRLYALLKVVKTATGPDVDFLTFHTFRHTWATWMRRYGRLDSVGLVATGAWRDAASAARYAHVVASEESRRAELLPVEKAWKAPKKQTNPLAKKHA